MIGAVCLKLNENCRAIIYAFGTYDSIDWNNGHPTKLGNEYLTYDFLNKTEQKPVINIEKSINGDLVLRLIETQNYVLKVEDKENNKIELPRFQNEGNKFLKCNKDSDFVTFQFINYLGRTKITFDKYNKHISPIQLEIIPNKINYEEDYIKMTEALAETCSELLMDYTGSTSNLYKQIEDDTNILLEQFIFLRKFCYDDNLQALFEAIKRNPDRVLDQDEELKPIGTGVPSKKFYRNPFPYSKGWIKTNNVNIYVPQVVSISRKFDKLDTPANRFIKFALKKFNSICNNLIQALEGNGCLSQIECVEEAKAIHDIIENIFEDSFFDEVGSMDVMPQNNQVLQKREGYSQIFSAYSMVDLALQLDWKGKNDIYEGESKNVALLYEYWLFFELYKIIKSIDGCKIVETKENPFVFVNDGVTMRLKEGNETCQSFEIDKHDVKVNFYYNRQFSRKEFKSTEYEGSYSRPFRPDFTLAIFPSDYVKGKHNGESEAIIDGTVSYVHFDAKYRISDLTSIIGDNKELVDNDEEFIEDKAESIINTYKHGDLLKMHTYNDAIRRTIGSYVLYPGSNGDNKLNNKSFRLYDEIVPGVGAFSIKPSISNSGENELKNFISSLILCKDAKGSRLNRMNHYNEMIVSEPSFNDVKFINSNSNEIQKDKMFVMGYIRDDYYKTLINNNLLQKESEFLFYFYAIKDKQVYSHHKDIFKVPYFRFYKNEINKTNSYILESVLGRIVSNELVSKTELVNKLQEMNIETDESKHNADFYYVLRIKVENDEYPLEEMNAKYVNMQNGNDTFSPHSPKVLFLNRII